MFIQFGHNDEKKENPKLYTEPGGTFDDNLRKFVNETRAKGGIPFFSTLSFVVSSVRTQQGSSQIPCWIHMASISFLPSG